MKFFLKIKLKQVKFTSIFTCRTMLTAFYAWGNKFPEAKIKEKLAFALSTRPDWKKIDDFNFTYKDGSSLIIKDNDTLEKIIKKMLLIENENFSELDYELFLITKEYIPRIVSDYFRGRRDIETINKK